MKQHYLLAVYLGLAGAMTLPTVRAQTPGAAHQVESVQQRRAADESVQKFKEGESVPEIAPGENSDVGPQSVVVVKPRKKWFEATADVQYFYTDNMFLTDGNEQSADVLVSTAEVALAPEAYPLAGGQLAPRVGYRHQWFDFGLWGAKFGSSSFDLNNFDFNAQTPFVNLRWSREDWIVDAGFDYTRLLTTSDYDEFYHESVPHWGVQRLFTLCPKSVLAVGYEGDYRFTAASTFSNQDFNDRTDHGLFVAATYSLCAHAVVQPYYRFKYTHFTASQNRDDYLNSFGIGLYCFFTRQISARVFFAYELLSSDGSSAGADYGRLDTGGGVNFNIRF